MRFTPSLRTLAASVLSGIVVASTGLFAGAADAQAADRAASKGDAKAKGTVREIEKGFFLKANLGTNAFIGAYGSACGVAVQGGGSCLRPVMSSSLSLGSEFVDKERLSVAWEVQLGQQLHNGPRENLQALPGNALIQGDIHTFHAAGLLEASVYLSRRFGLGIRGGGGVMVVPLLMVDTFYNSEIVPQFATGAPAAVHNGPKPMFLGGPTIEYYTKLSHFSVGIDFDAMMVIGLDFGIGGSGYLKYTF